MTRRASAWPIVTATVTNSGTARTTCEIDVPATEETVWRAMLDFRTFLCGDPFHTRVDAASPQLQQGVRFRLLHGFLGIGFWRHGRVLTVDPGRGFSFSDLSQRGRHVGFPHIYSYEIVRGAGPAARVRVTVRGLWTARWIPAPIVRTWLWLVSSAIAASLRVHFLVRMKRPRRHA